MFKPLKIAKRAQGVFLDILCISQKLVDGFQRQFSYISRGN